MPTKVFNDIPGGSLLNTPVNVPGWTVQNSATGTDEHLVSHVGPTAPLMSAVVVAHQTAVPGSTAFAVPAPTAPASLADTATLANLTDVQANTTAINLAAKKSDLDAVLAKVNALNAALIAAGIEAAS